LGGEGVINKTRPEEAIYTELEELCSQAGYIYVIAHLQWEYNFVIFKDKNQITIEEFGKHDPFEKLIRNEISILIGLIVKKKIDYTLPDQKIIKEYIEETKKLLEELHHAMVGNPLENIAMDSSINREDISNPFKEAKNLREPIFYGTESAYMFQYYEFAIEKYKKDDEWLLKNKGFSLSDGMNIIQAIIKMSNIRTNLVHLLPNIQINHEDTKLPVFTFRVKELASMVDIDKSIIQNFISCFILPNDCKNNQYISTGSLNKVNYYPILKYSKDEYVLLQHYSLAEAFYESPFFWFLEDTLYKNIAMQHRGEFTEEFVEKKLISVFGDGNVFTNIDIYNNKKKVGEIDTLVIYANRVIIVQAKSKKLTLYARQGQEEYLQNDFKKAVQGAYDQGLLCAREVELNRYDFIDKNKNKNKLIIPNNIKDIFIFCVTSEHYPALSFQSMQLLEYEETDTIKAPFVMDIFLLDIMTEMLSTPLLLLSYIDRRVFFNGRIIAAHELTILAYHMSQNLWLDENTVIWITDDVANELDLVMLSRKTGIPGPLNISGILELYKEDNLGKIIQSIEKSENQQVIEFGFFILQLSSETVKQINYLIGQILEKSKKDRKNHDFVLGFNEASCGITFHCNYDNEHEAISRLQSHCEVRKYATKCNTWYGLCLHPDDLSIRFGTTLNGEWVYDYKLEQEVIKLNRSKNKKTISLDTNRIKKLGRNEPCICGSGKKYKKCCLNK
jgi:hypothetical protein